jgi:hypothetical protein
MTKLITAFTLFVITFIGSRSTISSSASAGQFEQGMGKAFGLWKQGKVPKLRIYSKELPLLNLANGYQLLRSFGKHTAFWN